MCVNVSLSKRFWRWREFVSVPIVLETLEYRSDTREVVVSIDCVVRNLSNEPINLWLTHVDNVEGRLATEDWFSLSDNVPDFRAQMISEIHDGCWDFDPDAGRLRYRDPIDAYPNTCESSGFALTAQALSYQPERVRLNSRRQLYSDFIDMTAAPFTVANRSAYRLRPFPSPPEPRTPNETLYPYSTFGVGPISPTADCEALFFRLTIVIASDAYSRLVQPIDGEKFYVYSGKRVCEEIADFGLPRIRRRPHYDAFCKFYDDEIKSTRIEPEKYQIVICQPDPKIRNRKCVTVKPTSTRMSQRTISDDRVRDQAMWFSASSPDFSMVLEYVEPTHNRVFRIVEHTRSSMA